MLPGPFSYSPGSTDFLRQNPQEWQWTFLAQCMQTSVALLKKVYFKTVLQQKAADYVCQTIAPLRLPSLAPTIGMKPQNILSAHHSCIIQPAGPWTHPGHA